MIVIRFALILAISGATCIGLAFFLRPVTKVVTDESEVAEKNSVVGTEQTVQVKNRPVEVLSSGYASASSCARCHKKQHQSWHASYHRTMTQLVTPESAPEAIENTTVTVGDVTCEFIREDDLYFVKFDDLIDSSPEAVKKELVLMTGSHHINVFWYESPFFRTPAMVPIVYLRDQQQWIMRNSKFVCPPGAAVEPELGRWNQVCSRCHATHPRGRVNKQTSEWDTHVVDFGIACEACHGPGEGHIRFHDGDRGAQASDDVVVSPDSLPHHLQSDVCGQCHALLGHKFSEQDAHQFMFHGMPYRPGEDLEDYLLLDRVPTASASPVSREVPDDNNTLWSDGMLRVAGREYSDLVESPCFKAGELSCLSCHQMHPDESVDLEHWRDDQLKPGMRTNHACTQCHQESKYAGELTQHTHHAADSHGSQCMNCHMPHSTYGLFKSIRSHRVESPSVVSTLTTGRPNGCVLCHLDRNIGWVADSLTEWYGHQQLELSPMARETASGVVSLLLGDAGIRAIYASTFAWEPAREASGTDWMAPYLMIGLLDDYDAIRIIVKRTMRTLPGYEDFEFDELADIRDRAKAVNQYLEEFKRDLRLEPRSELLIDEDGKLDFDTASRMFNARDRTPIYLNE